ncbi:DUF4033 domain-containing protein [Citrus sinensis]|nr:DUF4033 domain-containing protein [Citrus sinensis]
MKTLPLRPSTISFSSSPPRSHPVPKLHPQLQSPRFSVLRSSIQPQPQAPPIKRESDTSRTEYKPGVLDDLFLSSFRNKLVQEVGLDSEKPGYDGLIELVNHLMMKGKSSSDARDAAIRILVSLFPPLVLKLYKILISPLAGGKIAAMMVARVTALTCQWLMGHCTVNSVDLPDGTSCQSGTFFKDYMGVPLLMEPNFSDYSCQFKFGILPPLPKDDTTLKEPCLDICPTSSRRKEVAMNSNVEQCPKA